jgi:hypothetical protein
MGEPSAFDRDELREWIPYAGDQALKGLALRMPSNVRAVYNSLCERLTIIHSTFFATHVQYMQIRFLVETSSSSILAC